MLLLINGQLLQEKKVFLHLNNRAFQYGDGFFETILLEKGQVRLWAEHWARIEEAAAALYLSLPAGLSERELPQQILALAQQNQCTDLARVKLKIWRAGEGLYTPQTDTAEWLLTAQPTSPLTQTPLRVGICRTVHTIPSRFSFFKGINSPVYVLASREKTKRGLDDLILLDPKDNLAELTSSNLFWMKGNVLFTPSLETGCVHGVMRRYLFEWAAENNWEVREGLFRLEELQKAEALMAGNVTGLRIIEYVEDQILPSATAAARQLVEQINLTLV
ncbi:aminotransferase IV [Rufibacter immobilis]|uniref:branched-chain-amino-acid transaminase n=1 Tax=Rufibacter immobilis TaxID=1348778 RepID=A0A3M9MQH7_9BACT|nr:aminotransferase class IV [Rufibacter immobilis]RNI27769.1 aminotransferase IV [Rufibacter immobilis]